MLAGWMDFSPKDNDDDDEQQRPIINWNLMLMLGADRVDWDAVSKEIDGLTPNTIIAKSAFASSLFQQPLFLAIDKNAPTCVIEKLLLYNPNAAKMKHFSTGLTPLFLAVLKAASAEVIRLLLEANPHAACQTAFNGCIALHFVQNVETAKLLLQAYPQGVKHCNDQGFLPLHRAAHSAKSSPQVVNLLIQVGIQQNVGGRKGRGGVFIETSNGGEFIGTPLAIINDILCNKQGGTQQCSEQVWAKFCYITQAAIGDENDESFKVLHGSISLGCADNIIQLVLRKHPEQVSELDRHGHSALSCAARTKDSSSEIIKMLLDADSAMACKSDLQSAGGRLPLHHMVVGGRPYGDGMEALIHAAPQVLEVRDNATELYPFQLAAVARTTTRRRRHGSDDLNTVYNLLRKTPWLVPPTVTASNDLRGSKQQKLVEFLQLGERGGSSPIVIIIVAVWAIVGHVLLQILWS